MTKTMKATWSQLKTVLESNPEATLYIQIMDGDGGEKYEEYDLCYDANDIADMLKED